MQGEEENTIPEPLSPHIPRAESRRSGFTLIEMSIVMVVIALIIGTTVPIVTMQLEVARLKSTNITMESVGRALERYYSINRKLPCPASGTAAPLSAGYGVSVAAECRTSCPAGITCNNLVAVGAVPFKTLGLNDASMYDAWSNRIRYFVDSGFTLEGRHNNRGWITVVDENNNAISSNSVGLIGGATYALISAGENGEGTWNRNGVATACGAGLDGENCDGDMIIRDMLLAFRDTATSYYDDIVLWRTISSRAFGPGNQNISPGKEWIDHALESNIILWLDAGDPSSLILNGSGQVSEWYDKSGRGHHVAQSSASRRPVWTQDIQNGLPVLAFDGVNDTMSCNDTDALDPAQLTFFVVGNHAGGGAVWAQFLGKANGGFSQGYGFTATNAGNTEFGFWVGDKANKAASVDSLADISVLSGRYDGTSIKYFINGKTAAETPYTTAIANTTQNLYVGGSATGAGSIDGSLGEVMLFNSALSDHDREQVECYLSSKWEIPVEKICNASKLACVVVPEFQVNTHTATSKDVPSIAGLADGGFVIAWQSDGQDGDNEGIYAQLYDNAGNPTGSEFLVNGDTSDRQLMPDVASLPNGDFVIVWEDRSAGHHIHGRRYDSAGTLIGSEFQVNSYTGVMTQPAVAALTSGGFVVTWSSFNQDGSNYGVYGQRFDSGGNTVGSEFQVNSYTTSLQLDSSVAGLSDGGFVIAWHSDGQDGSSYGIYGQRYDSGGNTVGSEFLINSHTASDQTSPSVAALASGSFVVVWTSGAQDGSSYGIYGQRYDSGGNTVGSEFQVNSYTTGAQHRPSVSALDDGGFTVIWVSDNQDGSNRGIYGQRYDSGGTAIGSEFQVNTTTLNHQDHPDVTGLTNGGFVVTWETEQASGDYFIFAHQFCP